MMMMMILHLFWTFSIIMKAAAVTIIDAFKLTL